METLASHTFVLLMYVYVFIYRNCSLLMKSTNMKKIIRLDALVSMRARAIPCHVVSILLGEKYILIHCLVKKRAKYHFFSLNITFFRMSPLKVNHDVITNYATSRKWVLHARKWVLDPKRHGVDVRDDVTTSRL